MSIEEGSSSDDVGRLELEALFKKSPIRPWGDFIAKFQPPKNQNILFQRWETNIMYYKTNYLIVAAIILSYFVLRNPIVIVVLAAIAAVYYAMFIQYPHAIEIGGVGNTPVVVLIGRRKAHAFCTIAGLLLVISGAFFSLIWGLGISSCVILFHASFRSRSIKSKFNKYAQDMNLFLSDPFKKKKQRDSDDEMSGVGMESSSHARSTARSTSTYADEIRAKYRPGAPVRVTSQPGGAPGAPGGDTGYGGGGAGGMTYGAGPNVYAPSGSVASVTAEARRTSLSPRHSAAAGGMGARP
eukprot:GFYU01004115.1.p1 GENE.GFYU01004115.1~~GFYU01004115.1.p1  ORF type:complete len:319 (-),score=67.50 GFYU01004115.1:267-1157(-)